MAGIGHNIKALRRDAGITIEEMAEYLSITSREMLGMEQDDIQPTVTQLERIGDMFAMGIQDIIDGKPQTDGVPPRQMREAAGSIDMQFLASLNRIIRNLNEMTDLFEQARADEFDDDGTDDDLGDGGWHHSEASFLDAWTARQLSAEANGERPFDQRIDNIMLQVTESVRLATAEGMRSMEVDEELVQDGLWPYVKTKLGKLGYAVENHITPEAERTGATISW